MKSIISTTTIDILTILTYLDTILDCRILQYYIFVSTLQEYNVSSLPRMLGGLSGSCSSADLSYSRVPHSRRTRHQVAAPWAAWRRCSSGSTAARPRPPSTSRRQRWRYWAIGINYLWNIRCLCQMVSISVCSKNCQLRLQFKPLYGANVVSNNIFTVTSQTWSDSVLSIMTHPVIYFILIIEGLEKEDWCVKRKHSELPKWNWWKIGGCCEHWATDWQARGK